MSVSAKMAGLEGDVKKVIKLSDNKEEFDYFYYNFFVVSLRVNWGFFFSVSIITYITNTYISVCGRCV